MSCPTDITDAEKIKRYDLLVQLKKVYITFAFEDKVGMLFEDNFEQSTVDSIIETMEQDIERWKT
jgi:hypothetical protein